MSVVKETEKKREKAPVAVTARKLLLLVLIVHVLHMLHVTLLLYLFGQ